MTSDQGVLFLLLFLVFGLLIWGRWRYDIVAFSALMVAVVAGLVPASEAFAGFGHPAVVVIALVLVVSRGLFHSGVVELIAKYLVERGRRLSAHIGIMAGFSAALSAVMNNVAALALLMPLDIQAADKASRSPALTLMPLSFASILGGMVTLIGTPPNIVIAEFRGTALGEPYSMFDFTPVGAVIAVVGVAFVALVGWRLIPAARATHNSPRELADLEQYVAELSVPESSRAIGEKVRDLDPTAEEHGVEILGLVRRGQRLPGRARRADIRKNDVLVIHADARGIEAMVGALGLEYRARDSQNQGVLEQEGESFLEVVVPQGSRFDGRSADSLRLRYRHDVMLLGVSRQGSRFTDRLRHLKISAGDVLLLLGTPQRLEDVCAWLGCLPLAPTEVQPIQRQKAGLAALVFGCAVLAAGAGIVYLPIALGMAAVVMIMTGIVPLRQVYDAVEWPVIVLLGSMIPLGVALETSGGTALLASAIVDLTTGLPAFAVLAALMIITMTLSDVMNNVATAVIAAPIALGIASRLGVNPDAFLMGVAVASSCAFLTPIGHKNNTLILGPGGYRFSDFWRMGLPLEILVLLVGIPMILWVWPL